MSDLVFCRLAFSVSVIAWFVYWPVYHFMFIVILVCTWLFIALVRENIYNAMDPSEATQR